MNEEQPLLVICGSRRTPSRTRELARVTAKLGDEMGHPVEVLDLREYPMELFDGRDAGGYDDVTNRAVARLLEAETYMIASPIYYGGISGALKNLIDHIPYEAFKETSRSAGLLATGRDTRHQLVIDTQLRATLVYLGVDVATTSAFATEADFDEFTLNSRPVETYIRSVIAETVALQEQ